MKISGVALYSLFNHHLNDGGLVYHHIYVELFQLLMERGKGTMMMQQKCKEKLETIQAAQIVVEKETSAYAT